MTKYTPKATSWLATVSILSFAALLTGMILPVLGVNNVPAQICLSVLGGFNGILFFCCYIADTGRTLTVDAEKIVFPRGIVKNGKTTYRKTAVTFDEIRAIESSLHKGNRVISKDCSLHYLSLNDGTKITVTLYAYGKEAEAEIVETIRRNIRNRNR